MPATTKQAKTGNAKLKRNPYHALPLITPAKDGNCSAYGNLTHTTSVKAILKNLDKKGGPQLPDNSDGTGDNGAGSPGCLVPGYASPYHAITAVDVVDCGRYPEDAAGDAADASVPSEQWCVFARGAGSSPGCWLTAAGGADGCVRLFALTRSRAVELWGTSRGMT